MAQDNNSNGHHERVRHKPDEDNTGNETLFPGGVPQKPRRASRDTQVTPMEPSRRRPVLITLDGRRVSERFVLMKEESVIGRDVRADVLISDGEASRRHAKLVWKNSGDTEALIPNCTIEDMDSTNGTYLNGKLLEQPLPVKDGDQIRIGRTVLGFFLKDERVLELDQMLMTMALHDALTGVFKREYFFSEFHREFDRSKRHERPLSLLMIDVDHFKLVNDECGHLCGDSALRMVANLIRASLREGDICGRYGGEEFAILLPETTEEGAVNAAERIREIIEKHDFDLGKDIHRHITVSIGVTTLHEDHNDKLEMLEEADKALYQAKAMGRNRSVLSGLDGDSQERTQLHP
ncbi:GGDEF domain-containing protein [bacterium]|nr:GGDEF domain-containing protein [bacterium]